MWQELKLFKEVRRYVGDLHDKLLQNKLKQVMKIES